MFRSEEEHKKLDNLYKKSMLSLGIITAIIFLFSIVSMVEFPNLFMPLAIAMIVLAIAFLLVRLIYNFRKNYKVKE